MAKLTNTPIVNVGEAVISSVDVPVMASLGWAPADHVFIRVEGQETVGEFYTPGADEGDDNSAIEFTVADLPVDSLLADLEMQDMGFFDLNDLLNSDEANPDGRVSQVSDDFVMRSDLAGAALEAQTSHLDVQDLTVNMGFHQMTIVIDDEPDPNTVAI